MGSASSGRRGGKPLIEDCQTIDLAAFTKAGAIREGWCISGKIEWPSQGLIVGDMAYRLDLRDPDAASLSLTYRLAANGQTMRQVIRLASTAQPLGGKRWWLLCPVTGQRARTLHLAPSQSRFASRGALGLAYRVERLAHDDRPFQKLFRVQRRLGNQQGLLAGLHRPRGMWRRTFAKHLGRIAEIDQACAGALFALAGMPSPDGKDRNKGDPARKRRIRGGDGSGSPL